MKWRKGPPPAIGWWPASTVGDHEAIRWWDGHKWSKPAYPWDDLEYVGQMANTQSTGNLKTIQWTDRWWEE